MGRRLFVALWLIPLLITQGAAAEESFDELIERLGHPLYSQRRDAQQRLLAEGLSAFDALRQATQSPDPEIASASKTLLNQMTVTWTEIGDPLPIYHLLDSYGDLPASGRIDVIDALSDLSGKGGFNALVRLARFDPDDAVARIAASHLLEEDSYQRNQHRVTELRHAVEQHTEAFGPGRRRAALWLALVVQEQTASLSPSQATAIWREQTRRELADLRTMRGQTKEEVVATLYGCWLRAALACEATESAAEAVRGWMAIESEQTTRPLTIAIQWAIDARSWSVAETLFDEHAEKLASKRGLYLQAEVALARGDQPVAEQLAAEALAAPLAEPTGALIDTLIGPRAAIARSLYERGLDEWSFAERRAVFEGKDVLDGAAVMSRIQLANYFFDACRYEEAAEVSQPLSEAITPNPAQYLKLPQVERGYLPAPSAIVARMHLSQALAARAKGDREAEIAALRASIGADDSDADIIIAMYQVEDPPADFAALTLRQLERLKRSLESEVWRYAGASDPQDSSQPFNQWAWLVANTEGDYEKAVRYSRRSLHLMPETASYLDTLGRCLFSAGRIEEAIETQRRAIELEPRMKVMQRQLAEFEEALAEQTETPE